MTFHYYNLHRIRLILIFISIVYVTSIANTNNVIDSLQNLINNSNQDSTKVGLLIELSKFYYNGSDCIRTAEEAINIAKNSNNKNLLGDAFLAMAWAMSSVNDDKRGILYIDSAVMVFPEKNLSGIANVLKLKGDILADSNSKPSLLLSSKAYENGVLKAQASKNIDLESRILNNWGLVLKKMNDIEGALEKHNASLNINKELGWKLGIGRSLYNIGICEYAKGNTRVAFDHYLQSYILSKESQSPNRMIETLTQIYVVFVHTKHNAERAYYKGEIKNLGFENPETMLDEVMTWPRMKESIGLRRKVMDSQIEGFVFQKKFESAYSTLQNRIETVDAISYSLENLEAEAELKSNLENEILKNEILAQELFQEKQQQKNTQLRYILLILVSLLASGFLLYRLRISKKQLELDLKNKELLKLSQNRKIEAYNAMISGQEQERKRIAQDLHDGLGNKLSAVKVQFNRLSNQTNDAPMLLEANEMLDDACKEVRQIAHNMMPKSLERHGLAEALFDLCAQLQTQENLIAEFLSYGNERPISDNVTINLYRSVQEVCSNIIKHANATNVMIQLIFSEEWLDLVVEDNGKGFNANEVERGLGLDGLENRVQAVEGSLSIDSKPGAGTTINISIPFKAA